VSPVAAVADPPPVVLQYAAATPATRNVDAVSRNASGARLRLERVDATFIA
jgi:hypothetical protein